MSLYKAKGIIVKSVDLSEADKIITIYSDVGGKISAVAKGLRKTKSKFGSRLEPFNYVQLLLYRGRSLDTITQVDIISPFLGIRKNLDKIAYASAMLDLVDKVAQEGQQGENKAFHLLLRSLEILDKTNHHFKLLLIAFDMKFMATSGYLPSLKSCAICEETIPLEKGTFSSERGGVLCKRCSSVDLMAVPLSPEAITILGRILDADLEKVSSFKIADSAVRELSLLTERYLEYYLQTRLRSRDYLSKAEKANGIELEG